VSHAPDNDFPVTEPEPIEDPYTPCAEVVSHVFLTPGIEFACGKGVHFLCLDGAATGACRLKSEGPFSTFSDGCSAQCIYTSPPEGYALGEDEPIPDEHIAAPVADPSGGVRVLPCAQAFTDTMSYLDADLVNYGCGEGNFLCIVPGTSADLTTDGWRCRERGLDGPFPSAECDMQCIYQHEDEPTANDYILDEDNEDYFVQYVLMTTPATGSDEPIYPCGREVEPLPVDYELCSNDVSYLCLTPGTSSDATGGCRPKGDGPFVPAACSAQCVYTSEV
jgi:hypothetical protein